MAGVSLDVCGCLSFWLPLSIVAFARLFSDLCQFFEALCRCPAPSTSGSGGTLRSLALLPEVIFEFGGPGRAAVPSFFLSC